MGLDPRDESGPRTVERESRHAADRAARAEASNSLLVEGGMRQTVPLNLSGNAVAEAIIKRLPTEGHVFMLEIDPWTDKLVLRWDGREPVTLFLRHEIEDNLHRTDVLDRRLRALGIEPVGTAEIPTTAANRDYLDHHPDSWAVKEWLE